MTRACVPAVHAAGRWWPAGQIEAMAAAWLAAIDDRFPTTAGSAVAVAVPSSPEGVALFAAASARTSPLAVLSPEPQFWPDRSPLFDGMPLVLLPAHAPLADEARRRGFSPLVLEGADTSQSVASPFVPLQSVGIIVHTSGSTGAPKPVYRPTSHLIAGAAARSSALGLRTGDGLVGGVPFSSGQGVVQIVTTMMLRGPVGIVGPVDYREVLATIAMPEFACWRASAHFADILGRCPVSRPPEAPRICLISSAVGHSVHRTFSDRFGVPLRGAYSSTETGAIAVDSGPPEDVRHGTVGRPLPGVEIRVGEDPSHPVDQGLDGRIWVRSGWRMAGYGVPPDVSRPGERDAFWPTQDLGRLDPEGRLTLSGRIDDCVRTRDGRLVNLEAVASALRNVPGVRAAIVLPLQGPSGPSFGAVLQCDTTVSLESLRKPIAAALPAWALPRSTQLVQELPRLPNGKPDRPACLAILSGGAVAQ